MILCKLTRYFCNDLYSLPHFLLLLLQNCEKKRAGFILRTILWLTVYIKRKKENKRIINWNSCDNRECMRKGQPSLQAFSAGSFLDSTMSCDVSKRYSPRTPSHYCQIKYAGLFCQVTATSTGSWKSVLGTGRVFMCMPQRQSLGFLDKDPQNQVLFDWSGLSGLSRAATCIRRSMNFFLQ